MLIRKQKQSRPRSHYPKTLTEAHIDQLLSLSAEHPGMRDLHDVLQIVLNTGARVGELCEVRWTDVDFPKQSLSVTANSGNVRHVPIDLETLRVLKERHRRHPESEYVLGTSPRVMLNRVSHKLAMLSISIGIDRISLHMLRSTFIERLVSAEADTSLVMYICGFSSNGLLGTYLSNSFPKVSTSIQMRPNL